MMLIHTHIIAVAEMAGKPGCYRPWEQLGQKSVCMSNQV